MSLHTKRIIIAILGVAFLLSLLLVQWMEVLRKEEETGAKTQRIAIPASAKNCVDCHRQVSAGIIDHWMGSNHARKGVGCIECHQANQEDIDAFSHYGVLIATIVTPRDCGTCHPKEEKEFAESHHAKAGSILASLDNFLAQVVEGSRVPFAPHQPTPTLGVEKVNGMASLSVGCLQCHGSKVALLKTDGSLLTVDELQPDADGKPKDGTLANTLKRDDTGKPIFSPDTWPNTGIGRINLDGSLGSCSACHSRHDFSPRRARQPENCGKCHLGPDHPQKEIYEESKHGVAYRDLREMMNLDNDTWVLGQDYSQAPTCATCHMSGNIRNGGKITHDPGERISWSNRPPVSLRMDTDETHKIVTELDPTKRAEQIVDTAEAKRTRMKEVCSTCHTPGYIAGFYKQYDDFIVLYNEKFAKPGVRIMQALQKEGLLSEIQFDEKIEWTWFYLWHHEGRRARHGASMMAPDYAHWHGMYEVAERFYMELIPEAREIIKHAEETGKQEEAKRLSQLLDEILSRPEHLWQQAKQTKTPATIQ